MSHRFHLSMHDDYDSQELSVHTDFIESDIFLIVERLETFLKGCGYNNDLSYYRHSDGSKQFRLLVCLSCNRGNDCSGCVRPQVKQTVFRTRDANSAINIMNLTKCWIAKQERPARFQISSFTTSNTKEEVEKVRPS